MTPDLTSQLLDAGLLQFGWFEDGQVPFQLNLDLLPSYPDVLIDLVDHAAALIGQAEIDHLICPLSALPVGITLSTKISVPLVYSRGTDGSPVFDLVGAYDIGHPALLVVNDLFDASGLLRLVHNAQQVGLEVTQVMVMVGAGISHLDSLPVMNLVHLPTAVRQLVEHRLLPADHGQAVLNWLESQSQVSPRPGSVEP